MTKDVPLFVLALVVGIVPMAAERITPGTRTGRAGARVLFRANAVQVCLGAQQ